MTGRETPLLMTLCVLVAWALFLGLLSGRYELFIVAVPLIVALLSARRGVVDGELHVETALSATRLMEGDRLILTVAVTSPRSVPFVHLLVMLPPTIAVISGEQRLVTRLRAGETHRHTLEVRSIARGVSRLGSLRLQLGDLSGLFQSQAERGETHEVRTYPYLSRVRHLPRPGHTRSSFGNYVSPRMGTGLEPGEIRPFTAGDDVRHINWRASLRTARLQTTHFHMEQNADIVLVLDTLAESGAPPHSSLDVSVRAAAALASAYLARNDRVGLIDYGGYLRWLKPASGPRQLESLLRTLLPADVIFTYVAKNLESLPRRAFPPQALVIAISPLLDERFLTTIPSIAAHGHDVLVLAVSPIASTATALPQSTLTDLACRLWALERRSYIDKLRDRGIPVIDWDPTTPLEVALAALDPRPIRRGRAW